MMLPYRLVMTVLAAVCLLTTLSAHAEDRGKGPRGGAMIQELRSMGVEASVIKQIKSITIASRKAKIPLKSAVELAKIELHELLDADEVNETAVMAAIDKVSTAKAKVRKNQVRTMLKIRALLTPQQRAVFKQKQAQRRGHRKHRRSKNR